MRAPTILVVSALLTLSCGARTPLDGDDDPDVLPPPEPSPLARSRVITIDSESFQSRGRLIGLDDMTGAGLVVDLVDGALFSACEPRFDAEGRLLFVDDSGPRIVRIDLDTGERESFGSRGRGVGQFGGLGGIALDAQGRIHVTDEGHRIVRIDDMTGAGWVTFGERGSGDGQLDEPRGIAVTSTGTIVVADSANGRLVAIDDMDGTGWRTLAVPPAPGQDLVYPYGVAVDRADRIHVVDFQASVLHRFDDMTGAGASAYVGGPEAQQMAQVFVAPGGRIHLAMMNGTNQIAAMDDMTGAGFTAYAGPADHPFTNPCGIVVRELDEP